MSPPIHPTHIRTLRVLILALSAFVFNTSEFVPVALLSDIGASFDKPASKMGIIMTIYAWVVALLSLPAMLITAKIERKRLLFWLFFAFVMSHILSMFAKSFELLVVSRIGVALAHAIFWSITANLVVKLAPKGKRAWALGVLATGSALATILGLPLGRIIGQYLSWRATFGVIGGLGLVCMVGISWILPTLPSKNAGSLSSLPKLAKCTPLMVVYATIMLLVTAHFTVYSYIEPFLLHIDMTPTVTTFMLLWFGVASIIGSHLFGRCYERFPHHFLLIAVVMLLICLILMSATAHLLSTSSLFILVLFWGVSMIGVILPLQFQTLKLTPKDSDVAMSLFSGIFNIGIGGGALLGATIISSMGLVSIGYVGASVGILALFILLSFRKIL